MKDLKSQFYRFCFTPFGLGVCLHTILLLALVGLLFTNGGYLDLDSFNGNPITFCIILSIFYLDYPINIISDYFHLNRTAYLLVSALLGGLIWGTIFAVIAYLFRLVWPDRKSRLPVPVEEAGK